MGQFLLGLDYGTGGAKACLIDDQGAVLGYAFEEYQLIREHPGWSEHDPCNYWLVAGRLIRAVIHQAAANPSEIRGIAVSSALPSMVMIDGNGNPIHRAYNLLDKRALDVVERLKTDPGEKNIFAISGYKLDDHPVMVNILWEMENRPDTFAGVDKVLTVDGFITYKLTGRAVTHFSGAAFYGVAYDLRHRCFNEELLRTIGIDQALLPELADCSDVIGEVTKAAASETGLVSGTAVAAGQVDCNASWVGAGAIHAGDFQANLGTVGNFGIIHNNLDFLFSDIGQLTINFPYTVDSASTYVTVPTTLTGGQSIRYLRDNFSESERECERVLGVSSYDLLNTQAEYVPPGCDGLIILPFMAGERTPIWDPFARGVIFGLSLDHGKAHLVRAMMEGVAFAMYDSYRLVKQAGLPIHEPMVLNEGGAVSRLWRQIIADVFNVPIVLAGRREGAPYGDAILAGVATGVFPSFQVASDWAEFIEPIEPDKERHGRYMEHFNVFKSIYNHVKDDFKELARIRGID